jgi:hypothetical protein
MSRLGTISGALKRSKLSVFERLVSIPNITAMPIAQFPHWPLFRIKYLAVPRFGQWIANTIHIVPPAKLSF